MMSEIVLVISNKPGVEGIKRAKNAGIMALVGSINYKKCFWIQLIYFCYCYKQEINHTKFDTREQFEKEISSALVQTQIDVVCLAGFMRVLTKNFVNDWRGRLLNIHPSLLPLFKGLNAQKQALESGVRVTGCTVHFVEVKHRC